jgi:hypothetical protein
MTFQENGSFLSSRIHRAGSVCVWRRLSIQRNDRPWSRLQYIVCRIQKYPLFEGTNSMQQSPSWEANSHSASQEIPHLLWNPKVHYHVHKIPTLARILSQMNQVHNLPTISRRSILILSYYLLRSLLSGLFPSGLSTRILYAFINIPCVLHDPPISYALISSP